MKFHLLFLLLLYSFTAESAALPSTGTANETIQLTHETSSNDTLELVEASRLAESEPKDPQPTEPEIVEYSCYSCMPTRFQQHRGLASYVGTFFQEPETYSKYCEGGNETSSNSSASLEGIGRRSCTDMCVSFTFGQKKLGDYLSGHLKGCMSDIFDYDQSAIDKLEFDEFDCAVIKARDLFYEAYWWPKSFEFQICICYGDLCNA